MSEQCQSCLVRAWTPKTWTSDVELCSVHCRPNRLLVLGCPNARGGLTIQKGTIINIHRRKLVECKRHKRYKQKPFHESLHNKQRITRIFLQEGSVKTSKRSNRFRSRLLQVLPWLWELLRVTGISISLDEYFMASSNFTRKHNSTRSQSVANM